MGVCGQSAVVQYGALVECRYDTEGHHVSHINGG